eukprot:6933067-Pyramimonas_sp.AAC.1
MYRPHGLPPLPSICAMNHASLQLRLGRPRGLHPYRDSLHPQATARRASILAIKSSPPSPVAVFGCQGLVVWLASPQTRALATRWRRRRWPQPSCRWCAN